MSQGEARCDRCTAYDPGTQNRDETCRARPPVVVAVANTYRGGAPSYEADTFYPETFADSWCREFELDPFAE